MSSRQHNSEDWYRHSQRGAQPPSQALWDRVNEPFVLLTGIVLFVAFAYNTYISTPAIQENLVAAAHRSWHALVYIVPTSILYSIDAWFDPLMRTTHVNTHASKSAAMKRVLGLESDRGIVASVFQGRTRALSVTTNALGLHPDKERPAGLGNRDNSCFQNSILQGLASLDTLPEYLANCLGDDTDADEDDGQKVVTQTLKTLISDLHDTSNNGRTLWTPSKLKFLSTWTQQDAQEYFSKILDDIDKRAARALKASERHSGFEKYTEKDKIDTDAGASDISDDSGYQSHGARSRSPEATSLRNPLEGLLAQRVSCVQCGHSDGLSMIPFNCLTLSLGLQQQHDLHERLDAYSHVEAIEGVECPKCTLLKAQRLLGKLVEQMKEKGVPEAQLAEPTRRLEAVNLALEEDSFDEKTLAEKCKITSQSKVTTTKTKQIVIARPPRSLAIHVNRSVFDPNTFDMVKNSAPVHFPMMLDLGPWCLGSTDGVKTTGRSTGAADEEKWLEDPTASMVAGGEQPSKLTGPIYELRAVVTHYGRHENGHYICYRKHARNVNSGSRESTPAFEDARGDVNEDSVSTAFDDEDLDHKHAEHKMDWWRLSDHNVSKVTEQTVSTLSPGVFMLFYDCVDPTMERHEVDELSSDTVDKEQAGDAPYEDRAEQERAGKSSNSTQETAQNGNLVTSTDLAGRDSTATAGSAPKQGEAVGESGPA
ncbi:ubiquitin hydrolase [Emericellopsis atlantica]|uniref:ubiquitinyl hydrolase 1 n=1 Tax=Emericellopsis atlantica TaxID=2614577 RepID=A0A9P7ZEY7_9HYPO|nr:ubiquitin hydrolase [Emericellopsis atlantica]KAG9250909.1 ubiquitin hydrolase [Emericellopsis atlantica]